MNDSTDTPFVISEHYDGILRLTLNRPQQRNCLSEGMLLALQQALTSADADPACRVIIIAADGPAFCAGHDLKQLDHARQNDDGGRAYYTSIMQQCATLMQTIVNHRLPVIAEVRGVATAAGCQLVASCDLAFAVETARFATPGVNIGLFCSTPMVALSRNISRKHAMELLLGGELISAARAEQMGLINRVVATDDIVETVDHYAAQLAAKSAVTLSIGKQAFYRQAEMPLAQAYDYAASVMVNNMMTADACEGINAFIEKRQPQWQDQ